MEHLLNTPKPVHSPAGAEVSPTNTVETELQSVPAAKQVIGHTDPTQTLDTNTNIKIDVQNAAFFYGSKQALFDVALPIREKQVTALIGPSGCGKSTFLRTLNRMNDLIPGTRTEGEAILGDGNIFDKSLDVVSLRQRVGMVFQRPNPFRKSIFDNVAYGLHVQRKSRQVIQ